jgi:predicted transcriptional regulator
MPYLELLTRNGLAVKIEGNVLRYKITAKGETALMHFREIEILIPDLKSIPEEEGVAV